MEDDPKEDNISKDSIEDHEFVPPDSEVDSEEINEPDDENMVEVKRINRDLKADVFEKTIYIPKKLWDDIFDDVLFPRSKITLLCDFIKQNIESKCVLCRRNIIRNKNCVRLLFYCRHKECRAYEIKWHITDESIKAEQIKLELYRSSNLVKHVYPKTRNLTGDDRLKVVFELTKMKPHSKEMEDAMTPPQEYFRGGGFG